MAIIDKILGRNRSLSDLSAQELRKEEILLTKNRDKLFAQIEKIAVEKQKIFDLGAKQKSPELRKSLAMDFELKSQQQVMNAKELNLRSKELLTVSRLRMIKENQGKGKALGRLKLTEKDVAKIAGWIEDDAVRQDSYQSRLDMLLELGQESDADSIGTAGLSQAGQELMSIWSEMDKGKMKPNAGYEQADEAVKRRQAENEK